MFQDHLEWLQWVHDYVHRTERSSSSNNNVQTYRAVYCRERAQQRQRQRVDGKLKSGRTTVPSILITSSRLFSPSLTEASKTLVMSLLLPLNQTQDLFSSDTAKKPSITDAASSSTSFEGSVTLLTRVEAHLTSTSSVCHDLIQYPVIMVSTLAVACEGSTSLCNLKQRGRIIKETPVDDLDDTLSSCITSTTTHS